MFHHIEYRTAIAYGFHLIEEYENFVCVVAMFAAIQEGCFIRAGRIVE
jgi:hypothetical protein